MHTLTSRQQWPLHSKQQLLFEYNAIINVNTDFTHQGHYLLNQNENDQSIHIIRVMLTLISFQRIDVFYLGNEMFSSDRWSMPMVESHCACKICVHSYPNRTVAYTFLIDNDGNVAVTINHWAIWVINRNVASLLDLDNAGISLSQSRSVMPLHFSTICLSVQLQFKGNLHHHVFGLYT